MVHVINTLHLTNIFSDVQKAQVVGYILFLQYILQQKYKTYFVVELKNRWL